MLCCFFSVFLLLAELLAVVLELFDLIDDLFDLACELFVELVLLFGVELDFLHFESHTRFNGVLEQDKERVEVADTEEICWKILLTEDVIEMRLICKPLAAVVDRLVSVLHFVLLLFKGSLKIFSAFSSLLELPLSSDSL